MHIQHRRSAAGRGIGDLIRTSTLRNCRGREHGLSDRCAICATDRSERGAGRVAPPQMDGPKGMGTRSRNK